MSPLPEQPISPLDGRYRSAVTELGEHLSEAGLNRARVRVEVEWLIYLTDHELFGSSHLDLEQTRQLRELVTGFNQAEIDELARLEATTRHDVKAVEYLVRGKLAELGLGSVAELTHFACTSEDINNLSYALTIGAAVRELWLPKLRSVIEALRQWADRSSRRRDACPHPRSAGHSHDGRQGVRRLRPSTRAGRRPGGVDRVPR